MKLITVVGARPQIIKSAAITHRISEAYSDRISEILVDTGQHYDANMSGQFFEELNIPKPTYDLEVGSASHALQTALMMSRLEKIYSAEKPNVVLVYGDTNSTLAAAITASKMGIAVAHIEAGMRSFNKNMPEEVNRVLTDHVSTYLFCPTEVAVSNLRREGFFHKSEVKTINEPYVSNVGDVMYDNVLRFSDLLPPVKELGAHLFEKKKFWLVTLHRASNTVSKDQVLSLLEIIDRSAERFEYVCIFPIHPRTASVLGLTIQELNQTLAYPNLVFTEALSYKDITWCANNARLVITDSGGLQKEAAFCNTPIVVLRSETEWPELINCGLVKLSDLEERQMRESIETQLNSKATLPAGYYGDGNASGKILDTLLANITT